eukprot:CAMPEP_0184485574 /NCGR_PEP_ID=MMETSP0113_2-20130426/7170_1 /TAXON_ID=91329 /ORGANISM="Norrisiella sphaerica, Strain BC52" /LENGTH=274 /DNA_ID=CAMNT_0026867079 /DNA_START=68 /DNA_END=892 /DNA_ORIENTATION=-
MILNQCIWSFVSLLISEVLLLRLQDLLLDLLCDGTAHPLRPVSNISPERKVETIDNSQTQSQQASLWKLKRLRAKLRRITWACYALSVCLLGVITLYTYTLFGSIKKDRLSNKARTEENETAKLRINDFLAFILAFSGYSLAYFTWTPSKKQGGLGGTDSKTSTIPDRMNRRQGMRSSARLPMTQLRVRTPSQQYNRRFSSSRLNCRLGRRMGSMSSALHQTESSPRQSPRHPKRKVQLDLKIDVKHVDHSPPSSKNDASKECSLEHPLARTPS